MQSAEAIAQLPVITFSQLMIFTFNLTEEHCRKQTQLSHDFIVKMQNELSLLPERSAYIEALNVRLNNILALTSKTDLNKAENLMKGDRLELLGLTAHLFAELHSIAKSENDTSDVRILKQVFEKTDLQGMLDEVKELVPTTVANFTKVYDKFWKFFDDEQRKDFPELNEMAEEYYGASLEGKFRCILNLYEMFNRHNNE
ncbi:uncharacterized protein LOC101452195 [Ceratitis capitata]|uniref:Uncharacterized protein n=1 Tax=Ceratitis capitata TaxID=7213 RepID=W8C237_CERCA|nr:uncharacterized protein LOC101452195 [Ceratitis capitata]XP_012160853.1 uncharacterized protein LOC101452195 [Ceratitis capitata]